MVPGLPALWDLLVFISQVFGLTDTSCLSSSLLSPTPLFPRCDLRNHAGSSPEFYNNMMQDIIHGWLPQLCKLSELALPAVCFHGTSLTPIISLHCYVYAWGTAVWLCESMLTARVPTDACELKLCHWPAPLCSTGGSPSSCALVCLWLDPHH